ncbi:MAG: sporulation protein YtfJ [Oscillospiraceae bacterium]|jgi:sporulation protein YtfJ|nr:sporulation protein YtfJ [Oscillospiraceae bacterium]
MAEQKVSGVLESTISKIRNLVDVSTIIGEPIIAEDNTIIPVSKVTYGFGSGGSDFPAKTGQELFGGGAGAGISITPVCFLVIRAGEITVRHIATQEGGVERLVGQIPEIVDKLTSVVEKFTKKDETFTELD